MFRKVIALVRESVFAPRWTFPRPGVTTFRPRVEGMEDRALLSGPAHVVEWTGGVSDDGGDYRNWTVRNSSPAAHRLPIAGDDLVFTYVSGGYANCVGFLPDGTGAYNSITFTSAYTGRVTLAGPVSTSVLR